MTTRAADTRVLAIGVDAAEPTLVRHLIERGELPALARLLDDGAWRRVDSPARIGSGAVWPTFFTGTDPTEHGVYSYWGWDPATMRLTTYDGRRFVPFWQSLARNGTTVGVLDVPFAPFVGLSEGFEVSEWGAHDIVNGRMAVSPPALRDLVTSSAPPHPFSSGHEYVPGLDPRDLAALSSACVTGAQARGDLATRLIVETNPTVTIVVFSEVHRAGHQLWHTIAPEHPLYDGDAFRTARVSPSLLDVYREVDRQIGRLVETRGGDARVLVFSLHGMQPTRGLATILEPLLCDLGFTRHAGFGGQSWAERGRAALTALRESTPAGVKKLYHRVVSRSVRHRLAPATVLPAYDWSRTRAFPLPTDQHGWIRINLAGREAEGVVVPAEYERTCDLLENALRDLATTDGRPLVRDVLRPPRALPASLPDLVVHWELSALDCPLRIMGSALESVPKTPHLTGQHGLDGFCITRGESPVDGARESVAVQDLHRLITAALPTHARDASRSSL